jgi:tRNA-dihydrouridine synthase 2
MRAIINAVQSRSNYRPVIRDHVEDYGPLTPPYRPNPEPPGSGAPLGPSHELRLMIPAGVSGHDAVTPTPGGGIVFGVMKT